MSRKACQQQQQQQQQEKQKQKQQQQQYIVQGEVNGNQINQSEVTKLFHPITLVMMMSSFEKLYTMILSTTSV